MSKARGAAGPRLYPIGAVTRGQAGVELAEFGEMQIGGVVAVSDDGKWLADGARLRRAFEHARLFGLPVIQHCEDPSLYGGASMHEGAVSTRLGLPGQYRRQAAPARDLLVAEVSGGRSTWHTSRRRVPWSSCGRPGPGVFASRARSRRITLP